MIAVAKAGLAARNLIKVSGVVCIESGRVSIGASAQVRCIYEVRIAYHDVNRF